MATKKSEAIVLLERAGRVPIDLTDEEAMHLMKTVLRLPLSYFVAVQHVVAEGRWKISRDPVAYVRTAAWRSALSDSEIEHPKGLPVPHDIDGARMNHDRYIEFLQACDEMPMKIGGVWRDHSYHYDEDGNRVSLGEQLRSRVPEQFCEEWPSPEERTELERLGVDVPLEPIRSPNWKKIAKTAGLDDGEAMVLEYMAMGLSRDRAMGLAKALDGESSRKKLQAAWRRFDRNRCFDRVASVLRS